MLCICAGVPGAFSQVGAGAKFSTLGIGFEAAAAVTDRSNVRGGFNFFNYERSFSKDGIDYIAISGFAR